jgi:quinol monooxygenase YgiN
MRYVVTARLEAQPEEVDAVEGILADLAVKSRHQRMA